MRFGIFVSAAGRGSGGPEVYERELLRSLAALDHHNEYHVFCLNTGARQFLGVSQENILYHDLPPGIRPIAMAVTLPWRLRTWPVDALHSTFVPPPFAPGRKLFTLTCSTSFRRPELLPPSIRLRLRFLVHQGVRHSSFVLCPSRNVRDLAMESFRLPMERFLITPMGVGPHFRPAEPGSLPERLEGRYGIRHPYFLYSGRWDPRKNIVGVLHAFAAFKRDTPSNVKLVLTGKKGWAAREAERVIARYRLQEELIHLPDTPLEELPHLYAGALALVYASLWEGFGMPILEAMACGTPVITSNVSAMPEVAGTAAVLVDPTSTESIAGAMQRVANDAVLRSHLAAAGLERAKLFGWENTARQTLAAYHRCGEGV